MTPTESFSSSLETLPLATLAERLNNLITRERHCLAEFLLHLAAFDRRRGYLELGYESLFVYCTDRLKMAKGTAYRRTHSARLVARFPVILDYLRDGRLSITSLCELREVLNEHNHREILERAYGLKDEEIQLLAATLNPKAEVPESIRRVPVRGSNSARAPGQAPSGGEDRLPETEATSETSSTLEPARETKA